MESIRDVKPIVLNKNNNNTKFAKLVEKINNSQFKGPVREQNSGYCSHGYGYESSSVNMASFVSNDFVNVGRSSGFSNVQTITPQFCAFPNF